ncbi:MAG: NlpC/P60 family protein [Hyphomicrobiales bacterium]
MDDRYLNIPTELSNDVRLSPIRDGVAAEQLQGMVQADKFAEGKDLHITAPVCVLKREPNDNAAIDSQLLYGERFVAFGEKGKWLWGQAPRDHYVGWIRKSVVAEGHLDTTHQVMSRGTFLYTEADMKSQPVMKIPMASRLVVTDRVTVRDTDYLKTRHGWLIKKHIRALSKSARDFVMVGESMLGMTYLWAGRSTFGLDCSGLVQLAMQMAGIAVLRDTDMQEATIGERVDLSPDLTGLKRGDLIFWPGHVGMMRDSDTLLHANGHTMTVFSEPLENAVERISYLYGAPRSVRRPFALTGQVATPVENAAPIAQAS